MHTSESFPETKQAVWTATAILGSPDAFRTTRMATSSSANLVTPSPQKKPVRINATLQFLDGARSVLNPAVFLVPKGKVLIIEYLSFEGVLPSKQKMWLLVGLPGVPLAYVNVTSYPLSESEDAQIAAEPLKIHVTEGNQLVVGARRSQISQNSSVMDIVIAGQMVDAQSLRS